MAVRIDGNNDLINAADGTLTVEGISVNITGISTASGGYKVGTAYTVFPNGNVATAGIVTATNLNLTGGSATITGATATLHLIDENDNPNYRLQNNNGTFRIYDATNDTSRLNIDSSGNISVGTAATIKANGNATFSGIVTATSFSGTVAASNLTGTIPTASLGSGTANSSTFLRGDSTFAAVTSTTINSNADNRVITGSDTANTLNGESNVNIASGILIAGHTASTTVSDGEGPFIQVKSTDSRGGISLLRHSANADGGGIYIAKSRNATIGSNTILQDDDELGRITFSGDDGNDIHTQAVAIHAFIDGTTGSNDMPGRLVFKTNSGAGNGSSDLADRLTITSGGLINIAGQGSAFGRLNVPIPAQSGGAALQVMNTATGSGDGTLTNIVLRSVNNAGSQWSHSQYRSQSHQFQVQTDNKVTINSNGLCFNSDTAAANALDDYEEGTYTAHFNIEGQSNMTMSGRVGLYCKVGQVVTVMGGGTAASVSGATSGTAIQFTNLPFPVHATSSGVGHPFPVLMRNMDSTGLGNMNGNQPYSFIGRLFTDSDAGRLEAIRADAAQDAVNAGLAVATNTELHYMFTYLTDA